MKPGLLALATAAAAALLASAPGMGASPDTSDAATTQPLGSVLLALSREHGVQLIFLPEHVSGLHTQGANSELGFNDALILLLRGTGLTYRYVDERTVTILPVEEGVTSQRQRQHPRASTQRSAVPSQRSGDQAPGGASAQPRTSLQEVLVTGSRLIGRGFEAPTPVKAVPVDRLRSAAPTSLGDALFQLPEFKNSQMPRNTGISTAANVGQSFLNLRALGVERTLVLLDGRRMVPSTSYGSTDISLLPEALIKRVEIVTGGASAAYGSDAVAGVVNFILDSQFTGVRGQLQWGASDLGDAQHERFTFAAGAPLLEGRMHGLFGALVYRNSGVEPNSSRDWFRSCSRVPNPNLNPALLVACDVRSAQFSRGGLIASGPLRGTDFAPGGVPMPFEYGALATQSSMVGGSGEDFARYYQTVPALERKNVFGRLQWELGEGRSLFLEALDAAASANYGGTSSWQGQGTAYSIYRDNAFLPDATREVMARENLASFPLSRYNLDFGPLELESRNDTQRVVLGMDMALGHWTLNAHLMHGENTYRQRIHNNANVNRLYNAADAVFHPITGQIVCRSSLSQPANGCVPLNLFGHGSPSRGALAWVLGTTMQNLDVTQDVFEASIAGEPVDFWAGPVSLALGMGWRRETGEQWTDEVSQSPRTNTGGYLGWPTSASFRGQTGAWERNNPLPLSGSYDVREMFAETVIPLVRDAPGIERIELNGAARYTHYSTSGGVMTWKAGLVYAVTDGWRLRVGRSKDIRAPNLSEMYRGVLNGQSNLSDPFQPADSPHRMPFVLGSSFGNPALRPEVGETLTIGAVYESKRWSGLSASIDYYDITLRGAITTLGGQRTLDQCFAGTTFLCQFLTRDANGVLVATQSPSLNIASRATNGIDVDVVYRARPNWEFGLSGGELIARAFVNYIGDLTTRTPGAPALNEAGQNGTNGVPHWSGVLSVRYDQSRWSLYAQQRFIGSGSLDNSFSVEVLAPEQNRVASATYTDLDISFRFDALPMQVEASLSVTNVFDRDPPTAPGPFFVFGTTATNATLYDTIGRTWAIGLRARWE